MCVAVHDAESVFADLVSEFLLVLRLWGAEVQLGALSRCAVEFEFQLHLLPLLSSGSPLVFHFQSDARVGLCHPAARTQYWEVRALDGCLCWIPPSCGLTNLSAVLNGTDKQTVISLARTEERNFTMLPLGRVGQ